MLRVVLVGDLASGKTTFLGLLYAAQVKSGSDATDNFRFHASFESLEEIAIVFQGLMSGSFPDSATKEGIHEIDFQIGYRRRRFGILPVRRSRGWSPDAFATLRFTLLRTHGDEISRLLTGSSGADGRLRDILDADAVVLFVDSTKLAAKGGDLELAPMRHYDGAIESLLTAIQQSRARDDRGMLYPIFVFSKFDQVDLEVLRAADVPDAPPGAGDRGPRAAYAQALLEHNLPNTLAKVAARGRGGMKLATPAYFFTWVRTEPAVPGHPEKIRLRRTGAAGWGPDYSKDECLAFLRCLRDVAARTGR